MKRNISNKILLIALITFTGCTAKRHLATSSNQHTIVNDSAVTSANPVVAHLTPQQITGIKARQINFDTFSAKAKVKMDIDGKANDVTMNIRIKKDQTIWVSVTALLGLEGMRALITPDSIKIINRLDATYIKKPFSYVEQYAGSQVNYQALQALIVGNAWPGLVTDTTALQPDSAKNLILKGTLQDVVYALAFNADMHLASTNMYSTGIVPRHLQVNYSGSMPVNIGVLPAQINISASSVKSKINIGLTYIKADFNTSVQFPFNVPARYSVVN